MNTCTWTRGVLTAFVAHDRPDLPDGVALHMDACADCRAHFDALLTPPSLTLPQAPAHLVPAVRQYPRVGGLAVAAVALLAVAASVATALAPTPSTPDLSVSFVDAFALDDVCITDDGYPDTPGTCPVDLT